MKYLGEETKLDILNTMIENMTPEQKQAVFDSMALAINEPVAYKKLQDEKTRNTIIKLVVYFLVIPLSIVGLAHYLQGKIKD